jgi:hypothetical protein
VIHTYFKCDDATKCIENLKYAKGYVIAFVPPDSFPSAVAK